MSAELLIAGRRADRGSLERYGHRVDSSQIVTFTVGARGRLTPALGSPIAAQATGPFGSEFRPTNPHQLFVSNAHAGAYLGTVSAFRAAANGDLTPIGSSPFADLQTGRAPAAHPPASESG
jgi:hypothetical protein